MSTGILKRFIILMAVGIAGLVLFQSFYDYFTSEEQGDFYVREGDIRLGDGRYDEALAAFDKALAITPEHRGAMMGRALVFIQTERYDEAIAELDSLIEFLTETLDPDDPTGRGVLAAAYSNRGVVRDRQGKYAEALDDYIAALNTDEETVSGPDVFHKILYGSEDLSTVRKRARYIYEQFQLPESDRLLSIPELDAKQRMYKP
jgi:tetratricopeptide (TPR) repeat protein